MIYTKANILSPHPIPSGTERTTIVSGPWLQPMWLRATFHHLEKSRPKHRNSNVVKDSCRNFMYWGRSEHFSKSPSLGTDEVPSQRFGFFSFFCLQLNLCRFCRSSIGLAVTMSRTFPIRSWWKAGLTLLHTVKILVWDPIVGQATLPLASRELCLALEVIGQCFGRWWKDKPVEKINPIQDCEIF